MQNKKELAIADFTKAIEIYPKYVDAYIGRGNAFADTEKFTQAIADYQKAISVSKTPRQTLIYIVCKVLPTPKWGISNQPLRLLSKA